MPNWEEVQRMMQGAQTPQEKNDAARALAELTPAEHRQKNITLAGGGTNVVNLGNLPQAMQSPNIFDKVKKVVTKE